MGKNTKAVATEFSHRLLHQEAIVEASNQELALYERFFQSVTKHANTHRQISINHLTEVGERLGQLKVDAAKLRDRILYHQEEVVVNRQKIIKHTEQNVHVENQVLLAFDQDRLEESLHTVDYLAQSLYSLKVGFNDLYQRLHLTNLLETEDLYRYFLEKSAAIESILSRHNQTVYDRFHDLDEKIKEMDRTLTSLLQTKNQKIASIEAFFEQEMKHYVDNQLTFSAEEDPTSIDIQALESDKINQFNAFKNHQDNEHKRLKTVWEAEYASLHERLVQGQVRSKALQLTNNQSYFDRVDDDLKRLREEIKTLDRKKDAIRVAEIDQAINFLKLYPNIRRKAELHASRTLRAQHRRRVELIRLSELTVLHETAQLKGTLDEYLALMEIDPFLAQTIGDDSSKRIKEFRNRLSMLRVNNELETNIQYDIQMTKLKHEINQLELDMTSEVKEILIQQEKELLLEINVIYHELLTRSRVLFDLKHQVAIERLRIDRAEQVANAELENLIETHALHRRHLTSASGLLIDGIRRRESHEIYVGEARNDLDLILKQYDMKALYFKTVYENEIAFFVSQKMRLDEESAIHHEFVLTTYQNQMRFAEEQIKLANAEYKTRMESYLKVIDEQRGYYQSLVENHYNQYLSKRKRIDEDYQATLYAASHLLNEAEDKKQRLALQKNVDYSKTEYEKKIVALEKNYHEHPVVVQSNAKLEKLDRSIEQALVDAEDMRDHTISEYSELYHKAKDRYDTLKPYFDKNINVMDPVFVDQMDRIKQRFDVAKIDAEQELEVLSKPLMDHYLQVYFAEADEPDLIEYKHRINGFETEKTTLSKQLQTRIDQIETEFAGKVKEADQIHQTQLTQITPMTTLIDQKAKTIETEYQHLLQLQKKDKIDQRNKLSGAAALTIETLTAEYHKALKNHAAMAARMTDQFAKLVDSYQPYIRLAKKITKFPRHLAIVKARHRRTVRADLRALAKRYRTYRIPTTKLS